MVTPLGHVWKISGHWGLKLAGIQCDVQLLKYLAQQDLCLKEEHWMGSLSSGLGSAPVGAAALSHVTRCLTVFMCHLILQAPQLGDLGWGTSLHLGLHTVKWGESHKPVHLLRVFIRSD